MKFIKSLVSTGLVSIMLMGSAYANDQQVLVTLTAESVETQGMALVLSNAMQAEGAQIHVLLCDAAGDLARSDHESQALAPRNVTPQQMLANLMQGGATVEVCALYLPNREITEADLRDGVSVAQPPAIAKKLLDSDVRTFNF